MRDRLVVVASPALRRPKGDLTVPTVVRGASDLSSAWDVAAIPSSPRRRTIGECAVAASIGVHSREQD